ncbi:MarR family winged helix-turn-helix transcriptional regulator [Bacillus sp. AK128]
MKDFSNLDNQLCFALYETSSEFTKLYTKVLLEFELTYPQYLVLLTLWEQDGLNLKQLGEKLGLGTGTLTPMLKRMEVKGWLKRERSITDERNIRLLLEEKALVRKKEITDKVTQEILSCTIEQEEYFLLMEQLNNLQKKLKNRKSNLLTKKL